MAREPVKCSECNCRSFEVYRDSGVIKVECELCGMTMLTVLGESP